MFAMLGSALRDGEDVAALVAEQAAAGLAVVTDGRATVPADAASANRLVDDLLAGRGSGARDRWAAAASASDGADRPDIAVAASLPGPWSLARRAAGGVEAEDGVSPDAAVVLALATALGREAATLAAAGCPSRAWTSRTRRSPRRAARTEPTHSRSAWPTRRWSRHRARARRTRCT